MSRAASTPAIDRYLSRQAEAFPKLGGQAPNRHLRLCVVIPAMAEHATIAAVLDSLEVGCERLHEAEVIVVVNQPDDASEQVTNDNALTLSLLEARRAEAGTQGRLNLVVVDRASAGRAFAAADAGVGAARRTGMDLALRRLAAAGHAAHAIIACLDGDSPVSPGHIDALFRAFDDHPDRLAGLCRYRHPIPADIEGARAIVAYEMWLRYYELCLKRANSPYAFQTIGSCTVITAHGYAMADGMPRKKAGEDFYMLQKLAKVGGREAVATLIEGTLVRPSARSSSRVPFGTGAAITHCLEAGLSRYHFVEPAILYDQLAGFLATLPQGLADLRVLRRHEADLVVDFITTLDGWKILEKLRTNNSSPERFARAFHTWFDGLRTVQFGHYGKERLGGQWIYAGAADILQALADGRTATWPKLPCSEAPELNDELAWLEVLRLAES